MFMELQSLLAVLATLEALPAWLMRLVCHVSRKVSNWSARVLTTASMSQATAHAGRSRKNHREHRLKNCDLQAGMV